MELMALSAQRENQTLALFEDLSFFDCVERPGSMGVDSKAANKTKNKIDPNIIAAERIAKQLQRKSKGRRISTESRKKGNEICEHLIAALKSQPIQGNLGY